MMKSFIKKQIVKQSRRLQMALRLPDILDYDSVLYVGANDERMQFGDRFRKADYYIHVLEIFPPNVAYLETIPWLSVTQGDVREAPELFDRTFDVVFWWHGPEHIEESELESTLEGLKSLGDKLIVTGCPWGLYEQGPENINPWQVHLSSLYPEDFRALGFSTSTIGVKDMRGSNLLAWYRK